MRWWSLKGSPLWWKTLSLMKTLENGGNNQPTLRLKRHTRVSFTTRTEKMVHGDNGSKRRVPSTVKKYRRLEAACPTRRKQFINRTTPRHHTRTARIESWYGWNCTSQHSPDINKFISNGATGTPNHCHGRYENTIEDIFFHHHKNQKSDPTAGFAGIIVNKRINNAPPRRPDTKTTPTTTIEWRVWKTLKMKVRVDSG